jgi:hypothetical protein
LISITPAADREDRDSEHCSKVPRSEARKPFDDGHSIR